LASSIVPLAILPAKAKGLGLPEYNLTCVDPKHLWHEVRLEDEHVAVVAVLELPLVGSSPTT